MSTEEFWNNGASKEELSRMQVRISVVALSLLGAVACGDDEGSVSSATTVGELSAAQARTVCLRVQDKTTKIAAATTKVTCTFGAVTASGGDESKCNSAVTTCEKGADDPMLSAEDCDTEEGFNDGVSADCKSITVGEIDDCFDATEKAFSETASKVSCKSSIQDLSGFSASGVSPSACANIRAKCPALVGASATN